MCMCSVWLLATLYVFKCTACVPIFLLRNEFLYSTGIQPKLHFSRRIERQYNR